MMQRMAFAEGHEQAAAFRHADRLHLQIFFFPLKPQMCPEGAGEWGHHPLNPLKGSCRTPAYSNGVDPATATSPTATYPGSLVQAEVQRGHPGGLDPRA